MSPNAKKFEVFICYKTYSADDLAHRLRDALLDHDISAFVDQMDIPTKYHAKDKWWEFRDNAIRECDTFVMIVTAGFGKSSEIIKEIKLAMELNKDFMCFRWFRIQPNLIDSMEKGVFEYKDIQQIAFNTGADLVRQFFDHYERKSGIETAKEKIQVQVKSAHGEKAENEKSPIVDYEVTQNIGDTLAQRVLPDVGFTIRNWSEYCIEAYVEIRVILGGKDLGLIKGGFRNGQYLGYYEGKTPWSINPYQIIFGHFTLPDECVTSKETLSLNVTTRICTENKKERVYKPISFTYDRNQNIWFFEPTSF